MALVFDLNGQRAGTYDALSDTLQLISGSVCLREHHLVKTQYSDSRDLRYSMGPN